jgi:beta-glucanase (GH16 family)
MPPINTPNSELVFSDEFNGSQLNQQVWSPQYYYGQTNDGIGNQEKEYYTPDSLIFSNGVLRLRATNNPINGFRPIPTASGYQYQPEQFPYRSGMISGHDKRAFTYGYMEIRAKLPAGQGLWPAFWMLPQSKQWPPEIDVMEVAGGDPTRNVMTLHYPDASQPNNHAQIDGSYRGVNLSQGFHTFAVKWEPGKITWYIDDVQRFQVARNVPAQPMYLLANLAVGGIFGGDPNRTTPFPSYFDIDYIRVYQDAVGTLHGGNGNDVLQRRNGTLSGEGGDDQLTITGNGGMYGGFGNDLLISRDGSDLLEGNAGDDRLQGGGGNDQLLGSDGADELNGSDVNRQGRGEFDQLTGGGGRDRFVLGSTANTYYKFQGNWDYVRIQDFSADDVIQLSANETYRVVRDAQGFDLYAVGLNNWSDRIADVVTSFSPSLPTGDIRLGRGQIIAGIFQGI